MSVSKITQVTTPLEEIAKINEIIDNLGTGGEGRGLTKESIAQADWVLESGKYVYTITGNKYIVSVYKTVSGVSNLVECAITYDGTTTKIKSQEAFNGFMYTSTEGGSATWGGITGTLTDQTDLKNALDGKQVTLESGTNIKTINNQSLLGSGNIEIQGGTSEVVWGSITGTLSNQTDLNTVLDNKQESLVSGTNIKTINNQSLLGSGNIEIQGGVSEISWGDIIGTLSNQSDLNTALSEKAPLHSPSFTGTPHAPTASADTNTTQIATTAFVKSYVNVVSTLPANPDPNVIYVIAGA